MRSSDFSRNAVIMSVVVVLLAGCGGSQSSLIGTPGGGAQSLIGAPGAMPRVATVTQSRADVASPSRTDLLYVVTSYQTDVLTYPRLEKAGALRGGYLGYATSNPNNGNVLFDYGQVLEYAHGGSRPIAKIYHFGNNMESYDGAFDPTTNNIALTVGPIGHFGGYVAVYRTPWSRPTKYRDPHFDYLSYLGYDGQGNLFVDGLGKGGVSLLAELPKGSSTFTDITLNKPLRELGTIQWDGTYITVQNRKAIYRLQVSGSSGTIEGKTPLKGAFGTGFCIHGDTVIGPHVSDPRIMAGT